MKKKKNDIWHYEIFHIIECFQIEKKKENMTWHLKSICFSFQKKKKKKKKNFLW